MAEQKFLGQVGTDVLVEKVKRNTEDILLQLPRSTVFELDMTKKNILNTLQSLTAIQHGLPVLCKGVRLDSLTLVKDSNGCALLFCPNHFDDEGENYLFSSSFTAKQYSLLEEGATIAFAANGSSVAYVWDIEGKTVRRPNADDTSNIVTLFTVNKYKSPAGITFVTPGGTPYIVAQKNDDNTTYNVVSLGGTSSTSIEEITAQEVSDKFNS